MSFTYRELAEHADLNSDGVIGFETQLASKQFNREVPWPEHFQGRRVDAFRHGSEIARSWMQMRHAVGAARRKFRHDEKKNIGIMTVLSPSTSEELKAEQITALKAAATHYRRLHESKAETVSTSGTTPAP